MKFGNYDSLRYQYKRALLKKAVSPLEARQARPGRRRGVARVCSRYVGERGPNAGQYHDDDFDWSVCVEEGRRAVAKQKLERIQLQGSAGGPEAGRHEVLFAKENVPDTERYQINMNNNNKTYSDEWEQFHRLHSAGRFFKEKRYLSLEFPCLLDDGDGTSGLRVGEIGCGCGSALIPVLRANKRATAVACDVSETATGVFREMCQKAGIENDRVELHVHAAGKNKCIPFQTDSCDIMMIIFTLSAMSPSEMTGVLSEAKRALKKGGLLLIRDYGQYDMAQLRFPGSQLIDPDNMVYQRADVANDSNRLRQGLASSAKSASMCAQASQTRRMAKSCGGYLSMASLEKYRKMVVI
eukprot:jgi/Picsp_1/590/NSC_00587-R1_s-adenosyl-l-methionine-dependent methyltransferase